MTKDETNEMMEGAIVPEEEATFPLEAAAVEADEGDSVVQRTVPNETDIATAPSDDSPKQENLEASASNSNPTSAHECSSTHVSQTDPASVTASDDVVPSAANADSAALTNPTVNETSVVTVAEDEAVTKMPTISDDKSGVIANEKEAETVVLNTTSSTVAPEGIEIDNTTLAAAAEHDNGPKQDEALDALVSANQNIDDTAVMPITAVVAEEAEATTESTTAVDMAMATRDDKDNDNTLNTTSSKDDIITAAASATADTIMAFEQHDDSFVVVDADADAKHSAGSNLCETNNEIVTETLELPEAAAMEDESAPPTHGSSMENVEQPQDQPEPESDVATELVSSSHDDNQTEVTTAAKALVSNVANVNVVPEQTVPPSTVETVTIVADIDLSCDDSTQPALQLDDEIARALNDETVSTIVDHTLDNVALTTASANVAGATNEVGNTVVVAAMETADCAADAAAAAAVAVASVNAATNTLPKETATAAAETAAKVTETTSTLAADETKVQDNDALAPADPASNEAHAPELEAATTTTTAGVVHTTVDGGDDNDKARTSDIDAVHSAFVNDSTESAIGPPKRETKPTKTEPIEASDATTEMTTMAAVPSATKDKMEDAPPLDATTTESATAVDNAMDLNDNAAVADQTTKAAVAEDDKLEENHVSSTPAHLETELVKDPIAHDAPVVETDISSVPVVAMDPSTPLLPVEEAVCEATNAMNHEDTAPTKDGNTKDVVVDDSVPVVEMDPSTPLEEAACEATNALNHENAAPTKDGNTKDVVVDDSVPVVAMDPSTPLEEAACEATNALNHEDAAPTKDDETKDVAVDDKDDACIAADADTSTAIGADAATADSTPNDDETVANSALNVSTSNEAEITGRSVEQVDEPAVPSPSVESEAIATAPPSDTDGPLEPSKEVTVDSPLDSMDSAAVTETAAIPSNEPNTKYLDNADTASVSTSATSSKSSDDATSKSPKQPSSVAAAGKAKFTRLSTTASAALSPSAAETSSPTKQRKKLAIPSIFEKGPSTYAPTTTTPTTPVRSFSPKKVSNAYVSSIAAKKELAPLATTPKGPVNRTFTPISAAKSWKGAESSKVADATVVDSSKQPTSGTAPDSAKALDVSNTNVKSSSIDAAKAPTPSTVPSIAMPVAAVDNAEEPTTSTTGKEDACSTEEPVPPSSSDDLKLGEAVVAHKSAPAVKGAESLNDGSTTETISNGTPAKLVIPTEANDTTEKMDKSETQATTRRKIAVPSIFAAPKQTEPIAPPKTPTRVWTKKAVVIPDNQFVPLPPADSASAFSVKRKKGKAAVTETTPLYSLPKPIGQVSADKPPIVEQAPSTTTDLTLEEQIAALEAEIAQTAAAAEVAKAAASCPSVAGDGVKYEEESYYEEAEGSENTIETLEEMHILSSQTEPDNPTCSAETAEEVVDTVKSSKDGDPTAVADSNAVDIPDNDIVKATATTTTLLADETESVRYDDNKVVDVVSDAAHESGRSTITATETVDEKGSSRNVDTDGNTNNATGSSTSIADHAFATPEEPRPKYVYKPPPEIEEPTSMSQDEAHPSFDALDTTALDTLTPDTAPFDEAAKLTSSTKIVKDDTSIPYDEVTLVPSVEGNISDVPHREISLMPTDIENSIASMPKTTDEIVQAECAPAAPAAAAATNQDLAGEPAQGEKAPKKKLRRLRSFFQSVKEKSKRRLVPGRPKGPKSQA